MRADRMNAYEQWGKSLPEALHAEWERSKARIADGLQGAADLPPARGGTESRPSSWSPRLPFSSIAT